jgi:hypothetical protein
MADTSDDLTKTLPSEVDGAHAASRELDEIYEVVGNTYTFVRSREINKTISGFTLDHYIDERKRAIKGERILRTAANPGDGIGVRPSQLDAINKLEQNFNSIYDKATKLAKIASKSVTP